MAVIEETGRLPWHMSGNYAPVADEVTAVDLAVIGALPKELSGRFIRNGANPLPGKVTPHWFLGDGMLHGIRIRDGKAEWYRNRWVRTKVLGGADRMAPENMMDFSVSTANTHVIAHAGRILALEEGAFPTEVTPELDTVGTIDYGGALGTQFTAHPKLCPETGEMIAFGYTMLGAPYLTYHRISADGRLVQSEPIDMGGPTMVHDFCATRHHAIFLDLPVVFDLERAIRGEMPMAWSDTYPARVGIMPREGKGSDTRWFEIDPCYVFHTMNAYVDDQGRVVLDAGRHASMWRKSADDFPPSVQWRWTFDLGSGAVTEQQIDDVGHGFPRVDDRRAGLPYRYGWVVSPRGANGERDLAAEADSMIVQYDLMSGARTEFDPGRGKVLGEPVFVPASDDAAEDEGWVMTYAHDRPSGVSSFIVFDSRDTSAPIAEVPLPQRVPYGFHGSWVAD